ncbi:alpha-1,2-fucosyltransferase [Flavobacteriales bacterium]|nr:alpha-1,2-fucosyltransferase [Flavobacteriales bacterium]
MIIVKIFQGPGNQMFQYAYGLAASKRLGVELKIDASWYNENSAHRAFILDRFELKASVATPEEVAYVKTLDGKNFLEYRFNLLREKFVPRHKKAVVKENLSVFDKNLLRPNKSSYVEGYFTTQNFFQDNIDSVRSAFQYKSEAPKNVAEIASEIAKNTIALSIRRGDFLGNPLHNICSIEYFYRALEKLKKTVAKPKLLIFSDDIDWIKANMQFDVPHNYVVGVEDHMDHMRLMSLCQHHIIPNSTFSWWGAWLSGSKNVVAPNLWLTADESVHQEIFGHWVETRHTVPESWIRIPENLEEETMM